MKKENIIEISPDDVPDIVATQFEQIRVLSEKIELTMAVAEKAKKSVETAQSKSARFGKKKEAIESIQKTMGDMAEAQVTAAESQKVSFEYQQELASAIKYLFALGCSSIAANRSVVQQLELKLKGASEKKLSELAKQEILNVVRELKSREDLMKKYNKLSSKVKEHDQRLDEQFKKDIEQDKSIFELEDNAKSAQKEIDSLKNNKLNRALLIIAIALGAIGVILGIIHFFI